MAKTTIDFTAKIKTLSEDGFTIEFLSNNTNLSFEHFFDIEELAEKTGNTTDEILQKLHEIFN